MTDVTRKKLSRGTKLTSDHVFGTPGSDEGLNRIVDDHQDTLIDRDNLRTPRVPFNVHLSWPYIDSDMMTWHVNSILGPSNSPGVCAPFLFPPLQEYFDSQTGSEPTVVLEELTYSFDQRREGAIVASKFQDVTAGGLPSDAETGYLNYDEGDRLAVRIVIYEKTPVIRVPPSTQVYARYAATMQHENYMPHWVPDRIVYELDLAAIHFLGSARQNPFTAREIGRQLDPYKTYMVALIYPALSAEVGSVGAARDDFAIPNVQLVLKCTHTAVETPWRRPVAPVTTTQNAPRIRATKLGPSDMAITTPAAGTAIEADTVDGIGTALVEVDRALRDKVRGGMSRRSNQSGYEALLDDSGMDVIVTPLYGLPFNGFTQNTTPSRGIIGASAGFFHGSPATLPYYTNNTAAVHSRRLIALPYPMEIHHVFACLNWQKSDPLPTDADPGITHQIGVGIGTGIYGDHQAYDQVARLEFVQKWADVGANPLSPYLIDRWTYPWCRNLVLPDVGFDGGPVINVNVSWEIYQVPLVWDAGNEGAGYQTQGHPFFAGQGGGGTMNNFTWPSEGFPRQVVATGIPGATQVPNCRGAEQWLEVRWRMIADDAFGAGVRPGWTLLTAGAGIVGYMGFKVIIVGRKWLTDGRAL